MNVMQRHHTKMQSAGLANDWDGKIWLS